MAEEVRYPEIEVVLVSDDKYSIMGQVSNALREGHISESEIQDFYIHANSVGSNLLTVCKKWITLK